MACVKAIIDRKGAGVATIRPEASALDAARLMNDRRIGSLMVLDGHKVMGIVTERDIMTRVVAGERDPAATKVSEIMTRALASCEPETLVEECRELMSERRIRRLPVIVAGRLVGIVTSGDVMRQEIEDHRSTIDYLHEYLESPATPSGSR